MYTIKRYQDGNGNVPYSEWIQKLRKKDPRAASRIDIRTDRAESGNFGDHKFARDGVWEFLLLIGGNKSTQNSDVDKAVNYWRDYQQE
ncbi:type II toxin-antitoxin system RelE/ParE family toxin [Erwinia sp. SLM-02]|uniref:type II toxin-antitoxin system RelE/ParE family toxin n=1 Tax=Erwinia sp. SLM-02 TaxID=3020057 RepID=UPI003080891A